MSEGTELGKAFVQIVPSAKGIKGATAKLMSGEAKDAGEKSGLSIASGIKKAIAVAGIGMALKKSLDLGGELQQNLGGTEAVFGKHADTLQAKAKEAYKNMGLSASDYMATANKMGSLFQGSGVSQVKSLDMTEKAMQRAADVASVMGLDTSMAMESIAGAAKGNFTMMDNLGVAMNATTLKAYALEQGINFDWNTADNAQKAELAMQMFMDRTSQYEGNFARESEETFSGSIGAMKAAAEDLMGNLMLGQNVDESMGALVESASTFLFQNLIPSVGNIFKSLPSAAATFLKTGIPELVSSGGELINGIVTGAAEKIPELIEKAPEMINQIKEYIAICDGMGLSAIVETHNEDEITMALDAGARIVGVNNRNLKDFTVDTGNSANLRKMVPSDILFVAESGIKTHEEVAALKSIGADAVLVGETLMRAPDKKAMLELLKGDL
jgi:antitoxin component of RelBE/YafQ-DinJ toxin-antitoxin module